MKNISITFLFFLFISPLLSFGQVSFSVQKIGNKGNSILFIPGLACSAELRNLVLIILATFLLWQDLQELLQ